MISLKIPSTHISLKNRVKLLFGFLNGVQITVPNITMEHKESLIIHSSMGVQTSVAVLANEDGSLRVLFSPPNTKTDYIDIENGEIDIEPSLRQRIEGK